MLSTFLAATRTAVRQPDWDIVRASPLYRNMSDKNFRKLAIAAVLQSFPRHVKLITEGRLSDFPHINGR
jgi:hypothetical protein